MALVIRNCILYYDYIFNQNSDPRSAHLPLVGSPLPIVGIITVYLYFVNKWGPKWMEKRKPFDLQNLMSAFNLLQILGNLYIMIWVNYKVIRLIIIIVSLMFRWLLLPQGFQYSYGQKHFSLRCQLLDYEDTDTKRKLVYITYFYFALKVFDLLDTVFFVLRKKNRQITFLHIYHHSGMVFGTYLSSKFMSGSHVTLLGLINSLVHVIMYTYYFLTAFKPELKTSLWWKKHITQVQLVSVFGER